MAAKLKEKWTSITTVPSIFRSFATFPTHHLFHYPLPLRYLVYVCMLFGRKSSSCQFLHYMEFYEVFFTADWKITYTQGTMGKCTLHLYQKWNKIKKYSCDPCEVGFLQIGERRPNANLSRKPDFTKMKCYF